MDKLVRQRVDAATTAMGLESISQLTPLKAMACLAIDGMSKSPLSGLDEESVTAALAGRFATQFDWCVSVLAYKCGYTAPAQWGQYSKNSLDPVSGEPKTGADFVLVIPLSETRVRVALFQAKKSLTADSGSTPLKASVDKKKSLLEAINLYRIGSESAPEDQLTKLRNAANNISMRVSGKENSGWAHYVCWPSGKTYPKSLSLSTLRDVAALEKDYLIALSDPPCQNFLELILSGVDRSGVVGLAQGEGGDIQGEKFDDVKEKRFLQDSASLVVNGWLEMTQNQAKEYLPKLLDVADIFVADERGEAGGLCHTLSTKAGSDGTYEVVTTPQDTAMAAELTVGGPGGGAKGPI